jgi:hypothetical protein
MRYKTMLIHCNDTRRLTMRAGNDAGHARQAAVAKIYSQRSAGCHGK